jgi:putative ABC transport system permease protein
MALALATGIAVATADRRRELAILEALGCSTRELASSVRWHGFAVVAIALLVGAPLGGIAGRLLYRAFASDLGVRPDVVVPLAWVAGIAVATVAVGWLAGVAPRRRLRREPVAPLLHGP